PLYIYNEVKEESLDVKDEPIDDFSDVNQEEPIFDIFCPSTGIARPLDHFASTISSDAPIKSRKRRRRCVVCHHMCNHSEMHLFTTNQTKRAEWVNGVRST
ncbi:hypothetical protein PMAYCL1PPCAC_01170, partial [Pristionchus mayeri]